MFLFCFPHGSVVMNLPAKQGMQFWSLGQEDSLEKKMVTYSSILAWEIPVRIQFMDFQKVRHDLMTKQQILILLIDIMEIKSNSWANTSDKFHMHTHTHTLLWSLHQWDYILEKQLSPGSPETAWELEVSSTAICWCSPVQHFNWQYHRTSKWNKVTLWPWWIIRRISLLYKHI